jgi:integrase
MARTKTAGIQTEADGCKVVDKRLFGVRIKRRLGKIDQHQAEAWLAQEIEKLRQAKLFGQRAQRTFREAAIRYLEENAEQACIDEVAWHLKLLDPYIGKLALAEVHDATLARFTKERLQTVSATTVRRSLEVVRRILNLAARKWREEEGAPWLASAPPLLSMPKGAVRKPYPLSWEEQTRLFARLPQHLARMALFKVNTGLREQEVVQLRWAWEQRVPELGVTVFVIPAHFGGRRRNSGVKNGEDRLVVLNETAKAVVDACRGEHAEFVFCYRGKPVKFINNSAWQSARREAGLSQVRVHDLKHTFGRRLRAAGVALETRKVLLGHKSGDITTHYSAPELAELLEAANRVAATRVRTLLRVTA